MKFMNMKKMQTALFLLAAISVFAISFFVGRASALKDREKTGNDEIYTGIVPIPEGFREQIYETPAAAGATGVLKTEPNAEEENTAQEEIVKMEFPCGETVLNKYSQSAVYSKTMDDWRAHIGIDYAAQTGTSVCAAYEGVVEKIYDDVLWGKCIEINHGQSIISVYRNLGSKISVKEGDRVSAGQAIATVGKSADIESKETAHLHFEIWQEGMPINPESYVY